MSKTNHLSDEIQRAPNRVLTFHSDWDQVVAYLLNKIKRTDLSPTLQEYVDRLYATDNLIREWGSRQKVRDILINRYGISRVTADQYYDRAQSTLGSTAKINQTLHVDILLGEIRKGLKASYAAKDYKAHAAYTKQYQELILKFSGNADAALYEKFTMQPIIIGFFPEKFKRQLPDNLDEEIEKIKRGKRRKEFGEKVGQYINYEQS
jgi:hypothetical protein